MFKNKNWWIKSYVLLALTFIFVNACTSLNEETLLPQPEENLQINLKWFSGSFNQTEEEMRTGLAWGLSSLGAMLPTSSLDNAITNLGGNVFTLDLSQVGFSTEAQKALQLVVTRLKNSPSYASNEFTELGRLLAITLNSSFHYYKIVGMPETLNEFRNLYTFNGKQVRVINSSISDVQRLIEVSDASRFEEIAFLATEGSGSFQDGTFETIEFEVTDFLPNGQSRFGLYDINGRLKSAADPEITFAGKPAKCLWCHEIGIQPFFRTNPVFDGEGFLSEQDFLNLRADRLLFLAEHRASLSSDVDFTKRQDHLFMERIYIDFFEPSEDRLAEEWNIPIERVRVILQNQKTHVQSEFAILDLYDRIDIDQLAPFVTVEVPEFARDFSENEPNFF